MSRAVVRLSVFVGIVLAAVVSLGAWQRRATQSFTRWPYRKLSYQRELRRIDHWLSKLGSERTYKKVLTAYQREDPIAVHDLLHWVGSQLYQREGVAGVGICDESFNWGCYHGFFGTAFAKEGRTLLPKAEPICLDAVSAKHELNGCLHGIGHGLLPFSGGYDSSALTTALAYCDFLTATTSQTTCYNGVFMEFNMRTMAALPTGVSSIRPYDPDNPLFPCQGLPEKYQQDCYYEQADWWRMVLNRDFVAMGKLCDRLTVSTARYGCFRGIGRGVWGESKFTSEKAAADCKTLSPQQGVASCIEVIVEELSARKNRQAALMVCSSLVGDLQHRCVSHLGQFACDTLGICGE